MATGPFCQVTTGPSLLPQGLYDPPEYSPAQETQNSETKEHPSHDEEPPAYSTVDGFARPQEKHDGEEPAEDVLHFLDPRKDTIQSLSLRYGVPPGALRRKNGLYTDHLLAARKTILIPGEFYKGGISLSPQPIDGEEEEIRKAKIRKFMVTCKVSDYDMAVLYLDQAKQDLDLAVEAYMSDEQWEAAHPIEGSSKSKKAKKATRRAFGTSSSLASQL